MKRGQGLLHTHREGELFVRVLPTRLAVVRLHASMLTQSTHAIISRLLFTRSDGARSCFWSYVHTDGEISLIVDESSLASFPEEAVVDGEASRWRPLRLCGKASPLTRRASSAPCSRRTRRACRSSTARPSRPT